MMYLKRYGKQAVKWVAFCLAVGGAASFVTRKGLKAFDALIKPPLTPPRIVFPIAWTILLILIGLGYAIVRVDAPEQRLKDRATTAFAVQITFFFCWMIWFFGLGWYGFSAIWLGGMLIAIAAMIAVYRSISKCAAWMQVPYFLWCCFAMYLNIGVWLLNK